MNPSEKRKSNLSLAIFILLGLWAATDDFQWLSSPPSAADGSGFVQLEP